MTARYIVLYVILAVIGGFVIGILIGRFATCPSSDSPSPQPHQHPPSEGVFLPGVPAALVQDGDPTISGRLLATIDKLRIRENLKELTSLPHVAGTEREHQLARRLRQLWQDQGIEDVTLTPYDVLLSYPDPNQPSLVRLLNPAGDIIYESTPTEAILTPEEEKPGVIPPFNAYSPSGNITGDLVYVNYGRVEDYAWLENNTNINVSGKIVIVRYGRIFRGSKVAIAQQRGATGVILYSDPADYAAGSASELYPNGWLLPPSGAQRGNIVTKKGDPLTPDYPAVGTAYRYNESEIAFLPKIPCHPIGYGIAKKLLESLDGSPVPASWQGGINITYRLGPGYTGAAANGSVELKVSTRNQRRVIYNVIGIIRGSVEPDRYVLVGNHRDAWVFGAVDPSSGTAVLMELARAMGQLVKTGQWRPRRSILFCSWGAEEFGLIGSTEWTEHYTKNLQNRAVAYINVDIAVEGNHTINFKGSPLLFKVIYEAAKAVANPDPADVQAGYRTVYDKWLASHPDKANSSLPEIQELGSGSDFSPFIYGAGISSVDMYYTYNKAANKFNSYPLYHSVYETFYAVENFFDRNFECHRAIARVAAELTRQLADSLLLPFSLRDYSSQLELSAQRIVQVYGNLLRSKNIDVDLLPAVTANFTETTREFETRLSSLNRNDPMAIRMVNDQLLLLERAFLDPHGLPSRGHYKHMIFAPSSNDHYASSSFPGLSDLLFQIEADLNPSARWERVKQHIAVLLFTLRSAGSTLTDVTKFLSSTL